MSWGALAGVASGLLGAAGSFFGGRAEADAIKDANTDNAALQREFAQHGIRWRVEDAKAAGIHPLAALGAQLTSPSPSFVGSNSYLPQMGQDLSRAIDATRTWSERVEAKAKASKMDSLQLQNAELQNQLLGAQIAKLSQSGPALPSNSAMPVLTGQGDSYVKETPLERIHSAPGSPGQEVGAVSDFGLVRTNRGTYAVVPSSDAKQRIEDQLLPELEWAFRNKIVPAFKRDSMPPLDPINYPPPKGYKSWRFNGIEYVPAR